MEPKKNTNTGGIHFSRRNISNITNHATDSPILHMSFDTNTPESRPNGFPPVIQSIDLSANSFRGSGQRNSVLRDRTAGIISIHPPLPQASYSDEEEERPDAPNDPGDIDELDSDDPPGQQLRIGCTPIQKDAFDLDKLQICLSHLYEASEKGNSVIPAKSFASMSPALQDLAKDTAYHLAPGFIEALESLTRATTNREVKYAIDNLVHIIYTYNFILSQPSTHSTPSNTQQSDINKAIKATLPCTPPVSNTAKIHGITARDQDAMKHAGRNITAYCQKGLFAEARRSLEHITRERKPFIDADSANHQLSKKFPAGSPLDLTEYHELNQTQSPIVTVPDDALSRAIRDVTRNKDANGKAADAYGLSYGLTEALISCEMGSEVLVAYAAFVRRILLADNNPLPLPVRLIHWLGTSRAIALPKKGSSTDVRPMCVPNMFLQVAQTVLKGYLPVGECNAIMAAAGQFGSLPSGTEAALTIEKCMARAGPLSTALRDPSRTPDNTVIKTSVAEAREKINVILAPIEGRSESIQRMVDSLRIGEVSDDQELWLRDTLQSLDDREEDEVIYLHRGNFVSHDSIKNSTYSICSDGSNMVTIAIDIENAFNCLDRDRALIALLSFKDRDGGLSLQQFAPVIAQYDLAPSPVIFVTRSGLMMHNKPAVTRTIMLMTQGVKQGGVFSNLLYSLTTLPVLEAARAHSWMTTAFLDDMSASVLSNDDVSIFFNSITPVLQQLGLQINIAKCKVGLLSKASVTGRPGNQPYRVSEVDYPRRHHLPSPVFSQDGKPHPSASINPDFNLSWRIVSGQMEAPSSTMVKGPLPVACDGYYSLGAVLHPKSEALLLGGHDGMIRDTASLCRTIAILCSMNYISPFTALKLYNVLVQTKMVYVLRNTDPNHRRLLNKSLRRITNIFISFITKTRSEDSVFPLPEHFTNTVWLKDELWCDRLIDQGTFLRKHGGLELMDAELHGDVLQAAAAMGANRYLPRGLQGCDHIKSTIVKGFSNVHASALNMFSTSTSHVNENFVSLLLSPTYSNNADTVSLASTLRLVEEATEPHLEAHRVINNKAIPPDIPSNASQASVISVASLIIAPASGPPTLSLTIPKIQHRLLHAFCAQHASNVFSLSTLSREGRARIASQSRPLERDLTTNRTLGNFLSFAAQAAIIAQKCSHQDHVDIRNTDSSIRIAVHNMITVGLCDTIVKCISDSGTPIHIQKETVRTKTIVSKSNKKLQNSKTRTDATLFIGNSNMDIDVTLPDSMCGVVIDKASDVSTAYLNDPEVPAGARDMRKIQQPYITAGDAKFLHSLKLKQDKYKHVPRAANAAGHSTTFDPFVANVDGMLPARSIEFLERVISKNPRLEHKADYMLLRMRASMYNTILSATRSRVYRYPRYSYKVVPPKAPFQALQLPITTTNPPDIRALSRGRVTGAAQNRNSTNLMALSQVFYGPNSKPLARKNAMKF